MGPALATGQFVAIVHGRFNQGNSCSRWLLEYLARWSVPIIEMTDIFSSAYQLNDYHRPLSAGIEMGNRG
jgi:hypothetical protein